MYGIGAALLIAAQLACDPNTVCWSYPTEDENGDQLYVEDANGDTVPMVEPDSFEIFEFMPDDLTTPINVEILDGDERFMDIPNVSRCRAIRAVDESGPSEFTGYQDADITVCNEAACHVE